MLEEAKFSSSVAGGLLTPSDDVSLSRMSSPYSTSSPNQHQGFGLRLLQRAVDDESLLQPFATYPFLLRFKDRSLESKFTQTYYGPTLTYIRIVTAVVVFLYLVFFIIDRNLVTENHEEATIEFALRGTQFLIVIALFASTQIYGLVVSCRQRRRRISSSTSSSSSLNDGDTLPSFSANFFDYSIITPTAALLLSSHGLLSGYVTHGLSSPLIPVSISMFIILRLRVVPSLLISSILAFVFHVIGLLIFFILHDYSLTILSYKRNVFTDVTSAAFGTIESFLLGVLIMFLVGSHFEKTSRRLFSETEKSERLCDLLTQETKRERKLLANVFPKEILGVVEEVVLKKRENKNVGQNSNSFSKYVLSKDSVVALINDIAGFTSWCKIHETHQVFKFLNDVYQRFDLRAQKCGLSKVKTIGDSWFGLKLNVMSTSKDSNFSIGKDTEVCVRAAMGMVRDFDKAVKYFLLREVNSKRKETALEDEESSSASATLSLGLRSGVALSSALVYVIGDLERVGATLTFDVIGDVVARANLLEASCSVGEVWVCENVRKVLLEDDCFDFREIELKSTDAEENGTGNDDDDAWFEGYAIGLVHHDSEVIASLSLPYSRESKADDEVTSFSSDSNSSILEKTSTSSTASSSSSSRSSQLFDFVCSILFRQNFRVCDDCHQSQSTFVRIVFLIVGCTVAYYAIQIWLVEFEILVQAVLTGLTATIILVCIVGVFGSRSALVGVGLQWVVFLLFQTWGIMILLYASATPRPAVSAMVYQLAQSIIVVLPFISLLFPSLPFLVKALIPLVSPFATIPTDMLWSPGLNGGSRAFSYIINYFNVYATSMLGMIFQHVNLLRFHRKRERVESELNQLKKETVKNERLLDSALPRAISERLLQSNGLESAYEYFENGGCLFCDVTLPTQPRSGNLHSMIDDDESVVRLLDTLFGVFDSVVSRYESVVKVKSTGSRYLCVFVGEDDPDDSPAILSQVASEMLREGSNLRRNGSINPASTLRFGLSAGAFSAGLCGKTRWLWDCLGSTINVACRLAETASIDKIHCSSEFADEFERSSLSQVGRERMGSLGRRQLKGVGDVETFELMVEVVSAQ